MLEVLVGEVAGSLHPRCVTRALLLLFWRMGGDEEEEEEVWGFVAAEE